MILFHVAKEDDARVEESNRLQEQRRKSSDLFVVRRVEQVTLVGLKAQNSQATSYFEYNDTNENILQPNFIFAIVIRTPLYLSFISFIISLFRSNRISYLQIFSIIVIQYLLCFPAFL